MTVIETASEGETEAAGRDLAPTLRSGDVVLLDGTLGAGKTAFVRGLAAGLGVAPDAVSSPTFTIVQEYKAASTTLLHIDLYRLTPADVERNPYTPFPPSVRLPNRWSRPRDPRSVVMLRTGKGPVQCEMRSSHTSFRPDVGTP